MNQFLQFLQTLMKLDSRYLIPVQIEHQIYTSLTRVQENLIVFNLNKKYQDFGEKNFEKFILN